MFHAGAVEQDLLGAFALALGVGGPFVQASGLQCAAVAERQRPRQIAELVHGVEMLGGLDIALPAGQEHDAGDGGRYRVEQAIDRGLGHVLDVGALGRGIAGDHHGGLQDGAFEQHVLLVELLEQALEGGLGDVEAGVCRRVGRNIYSIKD